MMGLSFQDADRIGHRVVGDTSARGSLFLSAGGRHTVEKVIGCHTAASQSGAVSW